MIRSWTLPGALQRDIPKAVHVWVEMVEEAGQAMEIFALHSSRAEPLCIEQAKEATRNLVTSGIAAILSYIASSCRVRLREVFILSITSGPPMQLLDKSL